MASKATEKTLIQKVGIALFVFALGVFIASLAMSRFEIDEQVLKEQLDNDYHFSFVEKHLGDMRGQEYASSFAFSRAYNKMMQKAQEEIKADVEQNKGLTTSDGEYWSTILQDYKIKDMRFPLAKASSQGFLPNNGGIIFFLSFILGIIGALMYILPQ